MLIEAANNADLSSDNTFTLQFTEEDGEWELDEDSWTSRSTGSSTSLVRARG